jgi:hypothetical protein
MFSQVGLLSLSYDLGYEDGHNWRCFSGVERVFIPFLWFMIFISTRWMFVSSNGFVKDSPKNAFCGFLFVMGFTFYNIC